MSDINHLYLADKAQRMGHVALDFGCGKGEVVSLLRERGVDAYGADVFWGGMDWDEGPHRDLLRRDWIREITAGRLPFDDDTFDVIVSDQVLEHVENLEQSVAEMARVLRSGGRMYHQFPTKNIVLEPHTMVPLAHRLPTTPRRHLLRAAKTVGLGRHPLHIDDPREWAAYAATWIDAYCTYRPRRVLEDAFRRHGFEIEHREVDNCLNRARGRRYLEVPIRSLPRLAAWSFRALGCDCIELRSAAPEPPASVRPADARA